MIKNLHHLVGGAGLSCFYKLKELFYGKVYFCNRRGGFKFR